MSNKYTVKAIDRALDVLERLAESSDDLTLVELAGRTDIPKSTLFRIMKTLQDRKCVTRDEDRKTYRLGFRLMELGNAFLEQSDLFDAAENHLEELANTLKQSVYMGILDDNEVVFVRKKESPKSVVFVRKTGHRAPAYCTATGLSILAFRPDEEVDRILDASNLEAHNPKTTTDPEVLYRKLEKIRQTRVAVVDGEYNPALMCVSSPVFDQDELAAASLTVALLPAQVSDSQLQKIKDEVRKTAQHLSTERGHFNDTHLAADYS